MEVQLRRGQTYRREEGEGEGGEGGRRRKRGEGERGGEKRERRGGEEGKEESVSVMSIHQSTNQSTNQPSHLTENHFEPVPLSLVIFRNQKVE